MAQVSTRREFLKKAALSAAGVVASHRLVAGLRVRTVTGSARLLVGTYTSGKSEGIYRCGFDLDSGSLKIESVVKGVTNPSYLAVDSNRGRLFCVNETARFQDSPGGSVSAFALNPETGGIRLLNIQPTHGADPCYVTVDPGGRYILVANYSGGNLTVLPVQNDGSLGEATGVVQHKGSSVKPRQQGPHAHCVILDQAGRFAYAADLGLDKVMIYRFENLKGALNPAPPGWAQLKPGAGPRHLAFLPDGLILYTVNELDSTLCVFSVDRPTGALQQRQTLPTLPPDFNGENFPADIHVSPSGRFVYCSNRGHDSIAVFAVNEKTGELAIRQHELTGGKWPRNFTIDPTGKFLLVANQRSERITVFSIDNDSGTLSPTGQFTDVPAPVCLKFL
jgi:6-phosphogluconolactonase